MPDQVLSQLQTLEHCSLHLDLTFELGRTLPDPALYAVHASLLRTDSTNLIKEFVSQF